MTGDDTAVAAVLSVLTGLRKRVGLQPDRLGRTEISASALLELQAIRQHADRNGISLEEAVLVVVRDHAAHLSATDRLIVDAELNLGLLKADCPADVDVDRLYADDLGPRRQYLCERWESLHRALSTDAIPPVPTMRTLRGAPEDRAFTALARRLVEGTSTSAIELLVIGDAVHDHVYEVNDLPILGASVEGRRTAHPGGKGLSRAIVLAHWLGPTVGLLGAVGGDEAGRLLLKELAKRKVDTSLMRIVDGQPTPIAAVLAVAGRSATIADKNDNLALSVDRLADPGVRAAIAGARALLLTFEQPAQVLAKVLEFVGELKKRPIVIAYASPPLIDPQALYPRLGEVDYLVGTEADLNKLLLDSQPKDAAQYLQMWGVRTVCTIQEFGCTVRTKHKSLKIPAYPSPFRGVPGAHGMFSAALAYRLLRSGQPADSVDFAWATAAMDITPQSLYSVPDPIPSIAQIDGMVRIGPVSAQDQTRRAAV